MTQPTQSTHYRLDKPVSIMIQTTESRLFHFNDTQQTQSTQSTRQRNRRNRRDRRDRRDQRDRRFRTERDVSQLAPVSDRAKAHPDPSASVVYLVSSVSLVTRATTQSTRWTQTAAPAWSSPSISSSNRWPWPCPPTLPSPTQSTRSTRRRNRRDDAISTPVAGQQRPRGRGRCQGRATGRAPLRHAPVLEPLTLFGQRAGWCLRTYLQR